MNSLTLLLIGGGGALGSMCRYALQQFLQNRYARPWPIGTGMVNVAGCLLAGLLLGLVERQGPAGGVDWRLLGITGFCGGFTTFSAFALENMALLRQGQAGLALLYMGGSAGLGVVGAAAGYWLARG